MQKEDGIENPGSCLSTLGQREGFFSFCLCWKHQHGGLKRQEIWEWSVRGKFQEGQEKGEELGFGSLLLFRLLQFVSLVSKVVIWRVKAYIRDIGCMVKLSSNKTMLAGLASITRGHATCMACLLQACKSLNHTEASKIHSKILHVPIFFLWGYL